LQVVLGAPIASPAQLTAVLQSSTMLKVRGPLVEGWVRHLTATFPQTVQLNGAALVSVSGVDGVPHVLVQAATYSPGDGDGEAQLEALHAQGVGYASVRSGSREEAEVEEAERPGALPQGGEPSEGIDDFDITPATTSYATPAAMGAAARAALGDGAPLIVVAGSELRSSYDRNVLQLMHCESFPWGDAATGRFHGSQPEGMSFNDYAQLMVCRGGPNAPASNVVFLLDLFDIWLRRKAVNEARRQTYITPDLMAEASTCTSAHATQALQIHAEELTGAQLAARIASAPPEVRDHVHVDAP
jgi:hypothetical protein